MITDLEIINACNSSLTMSEACSKVGLHFNTFKGRAIGLGVYSPNKGGKGLVKSKKTGNGSFTTQDILDGKHPQYQTSKLRIRLVNDGYKAAKCENCSLTDWNGLPISLELNHIDGNRHNHSIENLEILCPNCHSQTDTYRSKNRSNKHD
jgi:5-methylcytosine-specific restriction endonuclease McrA